MTENRIHGANKKVLQIRLHSTLLALSGSEGIKLNKLSNHIPTIWAFQTKAQAAPKKNSMNKHAPKVLTSEKCFIRSASFSSKLIKLFQGP